MKCENCGKNDVSFVFHSNVNGNVAEKHLCHDCAEQLGYARRLQESCAEMNSLLRSVSPLGLLSGAGGSPFFRGGMLADGFFGGGLLGESFFDDFFAMPRLSAGTQQRQAAPEENQESLGSDAERKALCRQRELNALRAEMKQAVACENFERAAKLRDRIRDKEKED